MIRLARPEDGPALAAIYAPLVESTYVTFEEVPPSAEEMTLRIAHTLPMYPWLVAEEDGKVTGYAYASPHRAREGYRWGVDTAIYLAPGAIGRGLGRALYEDLLPILIAQRFTAAYAGIALPNPASVRLHEAMGFRSVGVYENVGFKAGVWTSVGWWQRDLAPRVVPPFEPIPFEELRHETSLVG